MAENDKTAAGFEIDYDKLGAAVAKAVQPTFAEALKPMAEAQQVIASTLAQLPPAGAAGGKKDGTAAVSGDAPKALTADDVKSIVGDAIKGYQTSAQQSAERAAFVDSKMKDLPAAYRNQLGGDPAKWAAEEQAIRTQYQADFKAGGGKAEEVRGGANGAATGAAPAAGAVDFSKLSPVEKIRLGLKGDPVPMSTTAAAGGGTADAAANATAVTTTATK